MHEAEAIVLLHCLFHGANANAQPLISRLYRSSLLTALGGDVDVNMPERARRRIDGTRFVQIAQDMSLSRRHNPRPRTQRGAGGQAAGGARGSAESVRQ